jgi:hypothetical protein
MTASTTNSANRLPPPWSAARTDATKALLVQSRTEAGLSDRVAARNESSATLMVPDLAALGWAPPEPIAVLLVAAIAEIALIELAAGRRDKKLRQGLLRLATRARSG